MPNFICTKGHILTSETYYYELTESSYHRCKFYCSFFLHFCNIGMKIETTICKRLKKEKKRKKKLYQVHKILNFLWGIRKMIDRLPYHPPSILFIYFLLLHVVGKSDSQTQTYVILLLMEDACHHIKIEKPLFSVLWVTPNVFA